MKSNKPPGKGAKVLIEKIDPNMGHEEKARKYLEDVPRTFAYHLNDAKLSAKKR